MQLIRRLNHEELSQMIFDRDQQHLQQALAALPDWAQAVTERPHAFWERQQAEIRQRIARAPARRSTQTVTAWTGAFAILLLAVFLLSDSPAPRPVITQLDPDQELLIAVEQTVQSAVPQALEPAAMLAEEIGGGQPVSNSPRVYKENRNEAQ